MEKKKITIKNFLEEKTDTFKKYCLKGGKFLVTAPTGTGKTYTFIKIGADILKENKDYVFIFATPTKIQSEQNGINYDVYTVVSGVNDFKLDKVNTIVYDKLDIILNNFKKIQDKKIILIIDEAHELIYSKKYRAKAINLIKELELKAFTSIHLTATPRTSLTTYTYNEFLNVNKKNIDKRNIYIYNSENFLKTLLTIISSNTKKYLILINNKKLINNIKKSLEKEYPNKKIVVFTSDNKNSEEFDNLLNNNKLDENINIALCTNILNAGINILNKDLELVCFFDKNCNLDLLKQFIGRTRYDKTLVNIIIKSNKKSLEYTSFKSIKNILNGINKTVDKKINILQDLFNSNKKVLDRHNININYNLDWFYKFVDEINFNNTRDNLKQCIELDNQNIIKKNIEQISEYTINKYDSQFLNLSLSKQNINKLGKFLNGNITIINDVDNKDLDIINKIKNLEKENKKEMRELKKEITNKFNLLNDKEKDNLINLITMQILNDPYLILNKFKNDCPCNVQDLFNKIQNNVSLLNKFKTTYEQNYQINKDCLKILINDNFKNEELTKIRYKYFNKQFKTLDINTQEARALGNEYLIIRKLADNNIQKKLTNSLLLLIYNSINPLHKQVNNFSDIKTKDVLKLLDKIEYIYNICVSGGKKYISSLKK